MTTPFALFVCHHEETTGGLVAEAMVHFGVADRSVMIDDLSAEMEMDGLRAVVLLGSKRSVNDEDVRASWLPRLFALLDNARGLGVPTLGLCFGAQELCVYHGGSVVATDNPEYGWTMIDVVDGADLSAGPWFEFHSDRCNVPDSARVLASTPGNVQAFEVANDFAVQFHPELESVQLAAWMDAGERDYVESVGLSAEAMTLATRDHEEGARLRARALVGTFLSEHPLPMQETP